ncbi:MAG: LysE family translocator [Anaerolineae bacterium]|nr:LysE family translocator [Anaerolineae bacterium]
MALLAILVSAWIVGFSGAAAPGPISTLVVGHAARRGFWVGPAVTAGHAIAELTIVAALTLGLRDLLAGSHLATVIALAGGAFLIWMGATTLRDAARYQPLTPEAADATGRGAWMALAWAGLGASLSNPYWFLWWVTVGAGYVVLSLEQGAAGVVAFYAGHILSDLSWNSLLSLAASSGGRHLPLRALRLFLGATGVFLMGLGICFAASGLRMLRGG